MPKTSPNVVVTVDPNPGVLNSDVVIVASGITTDDYLNIVVLDSQATAAYPVGQAVDGQVSCTHHLYHPGTSRVEVRTVPEHGSHKVLGYGSFDVA